MKKVLLLLVLIMVMGGVLSAQEAHKNAFYFGNSDIFGFVLCYERILLPNLSLAIDLGGSYVPRTAYYSSCYARWYPLTSLEGWSRGLFLAGGLGVGGFSSELSLFDLDNTYEEKSWYAIDGLLVSPGIGYKFGFGKHRGFVCTLGLDVGFIFGDKTTHWETGNDTQTETKSNAVGVNPVFKLLFGYAF